MPETSLHPKVGFLTDLDAPHATSQLTLPGLPDLAARTIDGVAMAHVKAFIMQWLDLEGQIRELRTDQKAIAEAMKAQGVPTRTATMAFRQLKQRRSLDSTLAVFEACQELFAPLLKDESS